MLNLVIVFMVTFRYLSKTKNWLKTKTGSKTNMGRTAALSGVRPDPRYPPRF